MQKSISNTNVAHHVTAALRKLPPRPDVEREMAVLAQTLSLFCHDNPEAGRSPAMFRSAVRSTCEKELASLARQEKRVAELAENQSDDIRRCRAAQRLTKTLDGLHQPTILALADNPPPTSRRSGGALRADPGSY